MGQGSRAEARHLMGNPEDSSEPQGNSDIYYHEVLVELRGKHKFTLQIPERTPLLSQLRQMRGGAKPDPGPRDSPILQLPLDGGREALSVSVRDVSSVKFPRAGEHPTMNTSEGHLGGYISAKHPRALELGMEHGDSATWTPELWRWIREELQVDSVLDVGCGEGHSAGYFRDLGCRICGIDGSKLAQRDSVIPDEYVLHDYTTGPWLSGEDYDLVWSCEFVEHVEERYADNFLATFNCAGKFIFMTAAPPGQPGWHHVNCRPPGYWIKKIEPLGFHLDQQLTDKARDIARKGHFANMGLVFVRQTSD
jgi:SAM-dependent methyltransferase